MNKKLFQYNEDSKIYEIERNGITVSVSETNMSDDTIDLACNVLNAYPLKVYNLAEYLLSDNLFSSLYNSISTEALVEKLSKPRILITNNKGGYLIFTNQKDQLENCGAATWVCFTGVFQRFYRIIFDG